ncbi:SAC3/GANP/Nin1/mts3/eIF-3 p25 [Cynara cardunculus var. scolymus]|uniref:SAC3/GANP/Nin1/mts3/eIF-3 p25 n=1 Tax=Cynara cardunculus var. scolymus TaxID=59895 RepID=A0A118K5Y3_CYNCS|nr:SAC3/GANP/Nin1/mts3/eIF-3 p25 [Cynara cardunculus var. scolymus]
MMNQGVDGTITALDPNSVERLAVDPSRGQAPSYYVPSTGSEAVSWTTHGAANGSIQNGIDSSSSINHDQYAEPHLKNIQDGVTAMSAASTSNSGTANVPQEYASYAAYPGADTYGYGSTAYAGYNGGYRQQPNQSYPQQQSNQSYPQSAGAYQSTGAPHQPISSLQNTGSYDGSSSYSTTYYNPADYQTSGDYAAGTYSNQINLWNQGGYASYGHQYPSYPAETNGAYTAPSAAAIPLQYQQEHRQWADYYSQTEVCCAPGTENTSATSKSSLGCPVPAVTSVYSAPTNQQVASSAPTYWVPEPSTLDVPSVQPNEVITNVHDEHWKHGRQGFQNYHANSLQPNIQKSLDLNSAPVSFQDYQKPEYPHGPGLQYSATHQVPQDYQPPVQAAPQTAVPFDSGRVSKVNIPTNPRIASNFPMVLPRNDKPAMGGATEPAYVSVSVPKPNDEVPLHVAGDSVLKPGVLPKSLRGYVERALARCEDDRQMAACQDVLKEVIKKANADGTLLTRDWDTEPLFPFPNKGVVNNDPLNHLTPVSSLLKNRSPNRRTKSRWEPLPEEKLREKQITSTPESLKSSGAIHHNETNHQFSAGMPRTKENKFGNQKFYVPNQKATNRTSFRPAKRQRVGDGVGGSNNGDSSSDSDKEQSLTTYYAGAFSVADSPEEKKRRESRSKRFENNHVKRSANSHMQPKKVGDGNFYTRRASALAISKIIDDGAGRAVEDIDWDALTVTGTCQEIEKRYLRLTSAPDPATVRPEEVLEKALVFVQSSQRNYLYKCDQLKSIRQDLTVQRIRNELTAKVYETHARLAIEVGDLSEYNQCQSQLQTLYAEGIRGCHMEFSAYNLLCTILHSNNNRDLLSMMSRLSVETRKDDAVKHALAVRAAVTSGNYVMFFRLHKTAPNLNTCLMGECKIYSTGQGQ